MIKLTPLINNFIIAYYKREISDELIPKKVCFIKKDYEQFLLCQESLFEFSKYQINKYYPKSHIHILTNRKGYKDNNHITHHFQEFLPNHTVKFKLFGLLKEPAMYLDNDVYLRRKFEQRHLPIKSPFNCYAFSWINIDLQDLSPISLPYHVTNILNAGVIWIPKPNEDIVKELTEIHRIYFDHKEWLISKNKWTNNDEWSLSLYVSKHKLPMTILSDVNVRRGENTLGEKCQSIHYTGIEAKKLIFKEVSYFDKNNYKFFQD